MQKCCSDPEAPCEQSACNMKLASLQARRQSRTLRLFLRDELTASLYLTILATLPYPRDVTAFVPR